MQASNVATPVFWMILVWNQGLNQNLQHRFTYFKIQGRTLQSVSRAGSSMFYGVGALYTHLSENGRPRTSLVVVAC